VKTTSYNQLAEASPFWAGAFAACAEQGFDAQGTRELLEKCAQADLILEEEYVSLFGAIKSADADSLIGKLQREAQYAAVAATTGNLIGAGINEAAKLPGAAVRSITDLVRKVGGGRGAAAVDPQKVVQAIPPTAFTGPVQLAPSATPAPVEVDHVQAYIARAVAEQAERSKGNPRTYPYAPYQVPSDYVPSAESLKLHELQSKNQADTTFAERYKTIMRAQVEGLKEGPANAVNAVHSTANTLGAGLGTAITRLRSVAGEKLNVPAEQQMQLDSQRDAMQDYVQAGAKDLKSVYSLDRQDQTRGRLNARPWDEYIEFTDSGVEGRPYGRRMVSEEDYGRYNARSVNQYNRRWSTITPGPGNSEAGEQYLPPPGMYPEHPKGELAKYIQSPDALHIDPEGSPYLWGPKPHLAGVDKAALPPGYSAPWTSHTEGYDLRNPDTEFNQLYDRNMKLPGVSDTDRWISDWSKWGGHRAADALALGSFGIGVPSAAARASYATLGGTAAKAAATSKSAINILFPKKLRPITAVAGAYGTYTNSQAMWEEWKAPWLPSEMTAKLGPDRAEATEQALRDIGIKYLEDIASKANPFGSAASTNELDKAMSEQVFAFIKEKALLRFGWGLNRPSTIPTPFNKGVEGFGKYLLEHAENKNQRPDIRDYIAKALTPENVASAVKEPSDIANRLMELVRSATPTTTQEGVNSARIAAGTFDDLREWVMRHPTVNPQLTKWVRENTRPTATIPPWLARYLEDYSKTQPPAPPATQYLEPARTPQKRYPSHSLTSGY
jgi:hypothetical protein